MKILASDVGGTHVRMALVTEKDGALSASAHETLKSADYPVFEDAIKEYRRRHADDFDVASFSIAAPILNGQAKFPNRPWLIKHDSLCDLLHKQNVYLLNDLQSQAYGLNDVSQSSFEVLSAGKPDEDGNWALVAPGTGLGQALIHRSESQYFVMKSEAGHSTFGASNELQWELVKHLEKEMDHVSWEAVLSGPGIFRIYQFLRAYTGKEETPAMVTALKEGDPSAVVTKMGITKQSELAVQTCEIFVELLARYSADIALAGFATGGLFLGGGIVPHLMPLLKQPVFLRTFCRKGRMTSLLEDVPIKVVNWDLLGIFGAARYAQMKIKHDKKIVPMFK